MRSYVVWVLAAVAVLSVLLVGETEARWMFRGMRDRDRDGGRGRSTRDHWGHFMRHMRRG